MIRYHTISNMSEELFWFQIHVYVQNVYRNGVYKYIICVVNICSDYAVSLSFPFMYPNNIVV